MTGPEAILTLVELAELYERVAARLTGASRLGATYTRRALAIRWLLDGRPVDPSTVIPEDDPMFLSRDLHPLGDSGESAGAPDRSPVASGSPENDRLACGHGVLRLGDGAA